MKRSQYQSRVFTILAIQILLPLICSTFTHAGSVDNKLALAAAAAAAAEQQAASSQYYYDPNPGMYGMKDPILSTATATPTYTHHTHHTHPQPIMIPYPASTSTNGLHSMNMADLVDITKMSKKRQAVLRRRHNKSMYGDLMGDYSNHFTGQHSPLKARTEDIWALDGKAKHLEVLLLFVILAGLLLKVAFSLLWWKKALGGMAMGWGPMQIMSGGSGWGGGYGGGGGGGGGGWGWRQLDETTNGTGPTILQYLTEFVGKALDKGVDMYSSSSSAPGLAPSLATAKNVTSANKVAKQE